MNSCLIVYMNDRGWLYPFSVLTLDFTGRAQLLAELLQGLLICETKGTKWFGFRLARGAHDAGVHII